LAPPAREQDPKQSIPDAKARPTSSAALQHLIWWRSAIDSNSSAMRVLGSLLRATGSASLVGIRMNAGYSEKFETTNEFARIKF
jgi:hypothetical protein